MEVGARVRGERRGGQSPDPRAGEGGVVEVGDGGGVGGGEGGGEASTSFVSEESVNVDLIIRGSAKTMMVDEPQARHGVQGRLEVGRSVGKWFVGVARQGCRTPGCATAAGQSRNSRIRSASHDRPPADGKPA